MGAPGSNMGPMPGQPGFMNGRQVPGGIPPNMPPNSTTPFNHPGSAMLPPHMVQGMYGMSHGQPGQPGGPMGSMPPPPRGPPVPVIPFPQLFFMYDLNIGTDEDPHLLSGHEAIHRNADE